MFFISAPASPGRQAEESRYITTFFVPRGCYFFTRTPTSGLAASEACQKMEKILFGVEGERISIDDVVIHVPTIAEFAKLLEQVSPIQPQGKVFVVNISRNMCNSKIY